VNRAAKEALITDQVMKYCAFYYPLSLRERAGVRGKIAVKLPLILFPAGARENHARPFDGAEAR
jgi:hypothetical protein